MRIILRWISKSKNVRIRAGFTGPIARPSGGCFNPYPANVEYMVSF